MPKAGRTLTLPNLITLARLGMVPAAVWLILEERLAWAFAVFLAAGISDGVDGWLARVTDARSELGAMLDPLADKALLVSTYVALAVAGVLPGWLAALVVARDAVILGGLAALWLRGDRPAIRPLTISKLNTFAQIALAGLALAAHGFGWGLHAVLGGLVWVVAALAVLSLGAYLAAAPWRRA